MATPFLYHLGHRGEVLLARSLVRAVASIGTPVVAATCRGDAELWQGLGAHVRLVHAPLANTRHGAPLDLGCLCPPDCVPIELWSGRDAGSPSWQWADLLDGLQWQLQRNGLALPLGNGTAVPMLDFAPADTVVPPFRRPAIWLDTARTSEPACWFGWDLERLRRCLPDHELVCTAPPPPGLGCIDASTWNWAQRSRASEACEVLVGTTLDPFVATFTERNRHKPRAWCGYDARVHAPLWDWPGSRTEVLATMDELVDFLLANVAAGCAR